VCARAPALRGDASDEVTRTHISVDRDRMKKSVWQLARSSIWIGGQKRWRELPTGAGAGAAHARCLCLTFVKPRLAGEW
jgi:hypothetical protein